MLLFRQGEVIWKKDTHPCLWSLKNDSPKRHPINPENLAVWYALLYKIMYVLLEINFEKKNENIRSCEVVLVCAHFME